MAKPFTLAGVPEPVRDWFAKQYAVDRNLRAFEELIGAKAPADLRRYGSPEADPGMIFLPPFKALLDAKSSFEAVLADLGGMRTPLLQLFTGCYYLGFDEGNGDGYFAHVPGEEPAALMVVYDHELDRFNEPIALDLASGLYVRNAFDVWASDRDAEALAKRLRPVAPRVKLGTWPFSYYAESRELGGALAEIVAIESFEQQDKSDLDLLQNRSLWLARLLARGELDERLIPSDEMESDPSAALENPAFPHLVPSALYWLWREFFLAESERLQAVLARLVDTPSRILRDAVTLVREIEAGRKRVGAIEDMPALRERVAREVPKLLAARARVALEARLASLRTPTGISLVPTDTSPPAPADARETWSLAGERIVTLEGGGPVLARLAPDGNVVLHRGERAEPVVGANAIHGTGDGRVVITWLTRPEDYDYAWGGPAPVTIWSVYETTLVPIGSLAFTGFAIERVFEDQERLFAVTNRNEVLEVTGLAEARTNDAAEYGTRRDAALARRGEPRVVFAPDRGRPPQPPVDEIPEQLAGTPNTLELTWVIDHEKGTGYRMALVSPKGKRTKIKLPGKRFDRAALAPDGKHALVALQDELLQIDLASGAVRGVKVKEVYGLGYLADDFAILLGESVGWNQFSLHVVDLRAKTPAAKPLGGQAQSLVTLCGGRIVVLSRLAPDDAGWRTCVLGVKQRGLVMLAKDREDIGPAWESEGRIYAAQGWEILNAEAALAAAKKSKLDLE